MEFESRLEELKTFQKYLINLLAKEGQPEESYQNISKLLSGHDFNTNKKELMLFISLTLNVFRNHHRPENFSDIISHVFSLLLKLLKQTNNCSNQSLFEMFKNDKRILLYLVEQEVLTVDEEMVHLFMKYHVSNHNYLEYLLFCKNKKESQNGENHRYICELIRNDSIDEFITYVNQENIDVKNCTIMTSILETNSFLLKNKNTTLIEYAAFFGSIQIFNYLKLNGSELTPSLWIYSIHSNNAEMIQILEDLKIKPSDTSYKKCLKEAIKCHHNEIAEYIRNNYIEDQKYLIKYALKYYNYQFYLPEFMYDGTNENVFIYSIKYNHFYIIEYILSLQKIDVNETISYKNKEIYEYDDDEETKSDDGKEISSDWTSWDRIPKELRERDRKKHRNHWKSHYCNNVYMPPLHFAVENECADIVELLLNEPTIDVNKKMFRYYNTSDDCKHEKTALHIACEKKNLEIVKLLCSNIFINVNCRTMDCYPSNDITREQKTAIHIAIENGDTKIVDFLAHFPGIDINLKSTYERWWNHGKEEYEEKTPLNLAAEKGNFEICQILLSNPKIKVNKELIEFYTAQNLSYLFKRKETSFIIALNKGYYDIVKLLLENYKNDVKALSIKEFRFFQYDRRKQFKTPLFLAIENNNLQIVELLLSCNTIDVKNGLTDIGGGPNLKNEPSTGYYNPNHRNDVNKPIRPNWEKNLDYLGYGIDGLSFEYKRHLNTQKYFNMTEEEDIDDDFDFDYRIFKRKSPLDMASEIGNSEIKNILEIASNDPKYREHENDHRVMYEDNYDDFDDYE